MGSFHYLAIDPAGRVVRGTMEQPTEADVIAQLRRQGHTPMRAQPAGGTWGIASFLSRDLGRRGMARAEVAALTRELAIMLTAGLDLDRALRFTAETTRRKRSRQVVANLRDRVRDGSSLADAMAGHPHSFSRLYTGLVRAGEAGGTLAPTLERLATLLERQSSLQSTLVSAMIYPALLFVTAIGSIVLLLTQVLPQFTPLFEQSGAALPRPTQILIALGDWVSAYGAGVAIVLACAGLAAVQLFRRKAPRLWLDRQTLRLPVMRELLAARLTRTLGTLVLNGVPLIAALAITRDAVGNHAGMAAIERASLQAKGGAGLAQPLSESGVLPARTIHLLRLGEETAQLGQLALRAAEIHEEQTRVTVQRLVSLLVPVMTIAMGGAVAAIVSALLLAMLSLNDLAG